MSTEERVEKLERQNRWMRRIGVVGLALVAAIAVWSRSRDPVDKIEVSVHAPVIASLQGDLRYIQSKLGIEHFDFRFPSPRDTRLVATLVAKLDGKVVPELSGVFYIPPSDKSQDNEAADISITFFHPPYLTKIGDGSWPMWELLFHGHTLYFLRSPFDLGFRPGGKGQYYTPTSSYSEVLKEVGKEHKAWSYESAGKQRDGKDYEFNYTLAVRIEKLEEGEELGKFRRTDLPEAK